MKTMTERSRRKWAVAGNWAVSLFVMQRIYGEALKGTDRLAGLIGDVELVQPANEKLLTPMAVMQAFAIEQLLKSILLRGGTKPKKDHHLGRLYRKLKRCPNWPGVKKLCDEEYSEWRQQAMELWREEGVEKLEIEPSLEALLEKHGSDFVKLRYADEAPDGKFRPGKDRMDMFLALCALEATSFQAILDEGASGTKYSLTNSEGVVREGLSRWAKNLLRAFLADGGQDLSRMGNQPW